MSAIKGSGLHCQDQPKDRGNSEDAKTMGDTQKTNDGANLEHSNTNSPKLPTAASAESVATVSSQPSTLEWDHVPWEEFQPLVESLCKQIWPNEHVVIERKRGGGYNRIIGLQVHPRKIEDEQKQNKNILSMLTCLSVRSRKTKGPTEYILRVPRIEETRIDSQCALITFINKATTIPVPRILCMDSDKSNPLQDRYAIQHRLPGESLHSLYKGFTLPQKISFARQLGEIFAQLSSKAYPFPGQLDSNGVDFIDFEQSFGPGLPDETKVRVPPAKSTAKTGLEMIFAVLEKLEKRYTENLLVPWVEIKRVATELNGETGCFNDKDFYLCHRDFERRNILVERKNPLSVKITGILDWDEALFLPRVATCQPQVWLWRYEECCERADVSQKEIDQSAGKSPRVLPHRLIKRAFERAAGPEYMKLAYPESMHIARRLINLVVDGGFCWASWLSKDMEDTINDWEEMHGRPRISSMRFYTLANGLSPCPSERNDEQGSNASGGPNGGSEEFHDCEEENEGKTAQPQPSPKKRRSLIPVASGRRVSSGQHCRILSDNVTSPSSAVNI